MVINMLLPSRCRQSVLCLGGSADGCWMDDKQKSGKIYAKLYTTSSTSGHFTRNTVHQYLQSHSQSIMDSSTLVFIATLFVLFIFLKWFIASDAEDPQTNDATNDSTTHPETATNGQGQVPQQPRIRRREVTTDMIEVVQSLAPHLHVEQIKYDLQRTGSVQITVDRILADGTLPFPPNYRPPQAPTTNSNPVPNNIKPENLLKKYGVDETAATGVEKSEKKWLSTAEQRERNLLDKKKEMILKARKRLESQMKGEADLSQLQK